MIKSMNKNSLEDLKSQLRGLEYYIQWNLITLQDAVDLAVFLIKSTSMIQNYADGINMDVGDFQGVGGPIDVVLITKDGINWIKTTLPSVGTWSSVAYGNGKFIAINASSTSPNAVYSEDGINWHSLTLPTTGSQYLPSYWYEVAYGNNKFVIVPSMFSSEAIYSEDGINWYKTTLPDTGNWNKVIYGNGKFVAFKGVGTVAAYSNDGINWIETSLPSDGVNSDISYGNGVFIITRTSSNIIFYSTTTNEKVSISYNNLIRADKFDEKSNLVLFTAMNPKLTQYQFGAKNAENLSEILIKMDSMLMALL